MQSCDFRTRASALLLTHSLAVTAVSLSGCKEHSAPPTTPTPQTAPAVSQEQLKAIKDQLAIELGVRDPAWLRANVVAPAVFIQCVTPTGEQTNGTGVFLNISRNDAPLILTTAHTLFGPNFEKAHLKFPDEIWNCEIKFRSAGEEFAITGTAIPLALDVRPDMDLALLQLRSVSFTQAAGAPAPKNGKPPITSLKLSVVEHHREDLQLGRRVAMVGSPFSGGTALALGTVAAFPYRADGVTFFAVDATCFRGNSGGAVVSLSSGEIIGIVQRTVSDDHGNLLTLCRPAADLTNFVDAVIVKEAPQVANGKANLNLFIRRNPHAFEPPVPQTKSK